MLRERWWKKVMSRRDVDQVVFEYCDKLLVSWVGGSLCPMKFTLLFDQRICSFEFMFLPTADWDLDSDTKT